jgi:hypothetical protein
VSKLSDDELDELIDDMSEKEILWGIFQQQIAATRYLRTVATLAAVLLVLLALGLLGAIATSV